MVFQAYLTIFTTIDIDQLTLGSNLGCYISQRHGTEDIKDRNLTSHVLQGAVSNLDRLERINCDENKT